MAAQCRSPRCTAERKGFRRELDSWRHRLIHCVGFESILEGLYGPGLCKDLSLFDDCEPEELVDWCVDEKCSLCNLRKDTNDYTPSGGSAQSTPTGELISQGQFNTEKTECQAENYLHALFHKKDLPQNCDPNIPLVAQELMKKMIRQFAIEYVSKSRKMHQDSNGTIVDDPLGCNGIEENHTDGLFLNEQDSPLDLTVTRIEEQTFQDGVLDLSIKRNGSAFEENSKTRNLKNGVTNGYFLRKMKNSTKRQKENTALFKVLASWCLYHQQQLIGMLKFLKEERESCSQTCHSNAQSKSAEQIIRRPATLTSTCQICTNQKSTKSIRINGKTQQMNLPYLTVCLKDLRFTWPNINLGTVKLNLNKKEDVHLSDQLLHCINTRSKMRKTVYYNCLGSACSTSTRKLPFSSLSKLKIRRTVTNLKTNLVKHGLQCVTTHPECQMKKTSECCQIKADISNGKYMTVVKNVTFEECCASERQNGLKPNRNGTQISSRDSSTSSCVNFGSLIKCFLNSETNGFSELLNQKENCLKTGFHRNIEKNAIFNSSISDCQTISCARECNNVTDTFPKEKNPFVMNTQNSINAGITVSVKNSHDFLVLKDCKSTEKKCEVREKITSLPHDTLKIHSKNVNSITKSQLCLPANLRCFVPLRNVNAKWRENKRHSNHDVHLESAVPVKRNTRNILGKCKLCDVSHGLCSFRNNNHLFCKCTMQKNSGILKNFKAEGVKFQNTTENRNSHLKVVIERLDDSKLLANHTKNSNDVCKSKSTNLCKGKVKASSCMFNVPQKPLNVATQGNCLNSRSIAQTNCTVVQEIPNNVSKTATATTSSDFPYYSPIKLMFVSKVESEDGVKYTLSSEYTPVNKHRDAELSDSVVNTSHTLNSNSFHNRFSENMSPPSPPTSQNSPVKLLQCSDQSRFESKTLRHEKRACQVSKIIESSVEKQHKKCSQNTFPEAGSDTAIFNDKRARRKKYSISKLEKSMISKAYVVQSKESGTQLKIKKVERLLRSSERKLHIHASNFLNFQRISKRLKKLRKLSNVSETCTTINLSQKGGQIFPSSSTGESTKYTKKVSDKAKKDHNQKTNHKRRLTRSSLLITKLKCINYKTRSRKPLSTSFSSLPSSDFSVRSALCHKSKKLHLKCRSYRERLRSYKQQRKLPVVGKCTGSKDENRSVNIDFRPNTVLEWWSASTPKECLLKDLENRYEQIANTWLRENNGEKDNGEQSSSTLKFCSSETRSPVQMLFQKKCDIGDLAAWFMQTTETQSLSIVRKANARSPRQKINRKRSGTKAKKPSINSCSSKKHLQKCTPPSTSEKSIELPNASKISKDGCKRGQNLNNLKNAADPDTDVCVKFAYLGKPVDVTKACAEKATTKPSTKEFAQSTNSDASVPSSIIHIDSLASSRKQRMLEEKKSGSKAKTLYMCCSSKQNIQDCKVFLTKLDIESKMSSNHKNSIAEGKSKFRPQWKLKSGFTTKYYLKMNKSLARSTCTLSRVQNCTSKKCNFGMCLRKSKGPSASYNSHSRSLILERQKQLSKMTLYVETNTKRTKPQIQNMGKIQSECPKFQLGPIQPVRIPAIRGLSRKGGTYSLTPIRIPHQ